MFLMEQLLSQTIKVLDEEDYENCPEHVEITERLRRTLYYGQTGTTDRPSLPLTEITVEFLQEAAPRELGRVDTFVASNIGRRACMSPCSLMLGMIYIERLKHRNPEYLQQVSSSDLFLISMMVASKYLYDEGVDEEVFNDEWAESAKMDSEALNTLERNFLAAIDWNLFVRSEDFWDVLNNVEHRIANMKGQERGFYSYSDLMVLSQHAQLYEALRRILLEVAKVMLVCSVAYVAGTMTILGSAVSLMYVRSHVHNPDLHALPPVDVGKLLPSLSALYQTRVVRDLSPMPEVSLLGHTISATRGADSDEHIGTTHHGDKRKSWETRSGENYSMPNQNNERQVPVADMHVLESKVVPPKEREKKEDESVHRQKTYHRKPPHRRPRSTGSVTNWLNSWKETTIPGLLTVVLIKDTLLQFVAALSPNPPAECLVAHDDGTSKMETGEANEIGNNCHCNCNQECAPWNTTRYMPGGYGMNCEQCNSENVKDLSDDGPPHSLSQWGWRYGRENEVDVATSRPPARGSIWCQKDKPPWLKPTIHDIFVGFQTSSQVVY